MVNPALQLLAVGLLTTSTLLMHLLAKFIVHQGFGIIAIVIILASLKPLSRYLD